MYRSTTAPMWLRGVKIDCDVHHGKLMINAAGEKFAFRAGDIDVALPARAVGASLLPDPGGFSLDGGCA